MSFEKEFASRLAVLVYLIILVFLLVKKKYTLKQHLGFLFSYAVFAYFTYAMCFPFEFTDIGDIFQRRQRLDMHTLIPFKHWIEDYLHAEQVRPEGFPDQFKEELAQFIRFAVFSLSAVATMVVCRLTLTRGRLPAKNALRPLLVFILASDAIYIYRYYFLSEFGFDTAFILFQAVGFGLGLLVYKGIDLLSRRIGGKKK